jgi:hypothetical protein
MKTKMIGLIAAMGMFAACGRTGEIADVANSSNADTAFVDPYTQGAVAFAQQQNGHSYSGTDPDGNPCTVSFGFNPSTNVSPAKPLRGAYLFISTTGLLRHGIASPTVPVTGYYYLSSREPGAAQLQCDLGSVSDDQLVVDSETTDELTSYETASVALANGAPTAVQFFTPDGFVALFSPCNALKRALASGAASASCSNLTLN